MKMDLQKIKKQINFNEQLVKREPIVGPAQASFEMQRNQAIRNLEELNRLETEAIRTNSDLFLVVGAKDKIMKAFEKEGCLVGDHMFLAKTVASRFWPQFRVGSQMNAHIIDQANGFMDEICGSLGLNNFVRPKLSMEAQFQVALQSEEELALLFERMFQKQLKNQPNDLEGHVLQALVACSELRKKYRELDNITENLYFTVAVNEINDSVVEAYKHLLSQNLHTATFKPKINESSDEKIKDAVKSVLNKK